MRKAVLVVVLTLACSRGPDRLPIVVGATSNPGSTRLADLVVAKLERAGCRVERRYNIGDSRAADAALTGGSIDAYVESQRRALLEVLREPEPVSRRIETVVRPLYANRDLYWSPPIGSGDLAVVFRRDIDRKCRAASRALMRIAYAAER